MNLKNIGLFLKTNRQEKGFSINEVAKRFNVSDNEVVNWENGVSLPSGEDMPILAKMLGVSIEELYNGELINKKMTKHKGDILTMFSSVMILAAILSFFLLRTIELEVAIMSAISFVSNSISEDSSSSHIYESRFINFME